MRKTTDRRYLPIRFVSLETEGFSFFPRQEVQLHANINGLIGLNGAGKTTFLNMIRVLIGSRKYDNNQSLHTFFERDDVHEIYIVARFDNKIHPVYGRRPFEAIGKREDIVSVVCRIKRDPLKRDYLIFDGYFDLENDLKSYIRWVSVDQYARQMQAVGLTRSLINACSLSQGNTEELMKKTEEELADYILQICGEQERIDRFNEIKEEIKQHQEQYHHMNVLKKQEELSLKEIEYNLSLCKQIVEQQSQLIQLQHELPLAEYAKIDKELSQRTEAMSAIHDQLQEINHTVIQYEQSLSNCQNEMKLAEAEAARLTQDLQTLNERKTNVAVTLHDVQREVTQLHEFIEKYHLIPLRDMAVLHQEKKIQEKSYQGLLAQSKIYQDQRLELETKISKMEKSRKTEYPATVIQMKKWLEDQNIDYLLVADCIEIIDEPWREAIEAMLGNERFTLTVPTEHLVLVMEAAQKSRYPYWISPFKPAVLSLSKEAVLNKVKITDERVIGYLERFKRVMVSENMTDAWTWVKKGFSALLHKPFPYQVVERGGRSIRVKELCCGKQAYEAQLLEYRRQLEHLIPLVSQAELLEQEAKNTLQELTETIQIQIQVHQLDTKRNDLKNASERQDQLTQSLAEHNIEIQEYSNRLLEESKRQSALNGEASSYHAYLQQYQENRNHLNTKFATLEQEKKDIESQIIDAKKTLSEEQLNLILQPDFLASLGDSKHYKHQIDFKKSHIESLRKSITPGVIQPGEEIATLKLTQSYEKHRILLNQHLDEIEKIRNDLNDLEVKRAQAKEEYRTMVDEVFQKVRQSLESMAKKGNFEASLRAVYMEDERWKVDYRLGFNGKPAKSYRDKSAISGGQRVIASLLLTFAAIKADGVLSFMLLDEPFAHLDEERIGLAGDFLSSTDAQFFIGMPYSENIKLLMPWINTLLNFRPKANDNPVAPPITYGEVR